MNYILNITKIFHKEGGFTAWTCTDLQSVRTQMGKLLSETHGQHNFSEWEMIVPQNDTKGNLKGEEQPYGLYIRHCSVCGTQEMWKHFPPQPDPKKEEDGGSHTFIIVLVAVGVVLVLAVGGFIFIKKRRGDSGMGDMKQKINEMDRDMTGYN